MKINRKTVLSAAAVLGVAALAAGGTIAYFTDSDSKTNHFTVGDVDITLYESQLHRENSGIQGTVGALATDANYCDYTEQYEGVNYNRTGTELAKLLTYDGMRYCTPNTNANNTEGISAVTNGHTRDGFNNANRTWGYSDANIIADATNDTTSENHITNGYTAYFNAEASYIVPGQQIRKFSYVKNTGKNDAFVLIRYIIPSEIADNVTLKVPGTPYEEDIDPNTDNIQPYFYAVNYNETDGYSVFDMSANNNNIDNYHGYTYTDDTTDKEYTVYAAITRQALEPEEMTFWSPVNTIKIKTDATEADFVNYSAFDIEVKADAIQAFTFADAIEAINEL